jgi:hypothetical protein
MVMQNDGGTSDRGESERSQRLDRAAAAVSEDASCVGQWQVDRIRAESGPDVTDAEARAALERWGVRIAELPGLPDRVPGAIGPHQDYANAVARLGHKLSIELVFGNGVKDCLSLLGGIRLDDGRHLNGEAIEEALRRTPPRSHREDWNSVLSILAEAALEPGALDDIVFWEFVAALRPLAPLGYSQRAITEQAVRLSLKRDQAEVLAAAVAEEHQVRQPPRPAAKLQIERGPVEADQIAGREPPGEPGLPALDPLPGEVLQPVTDLQFRRMGGGTDVVQLSWSPPPAGVVTLQLAGMPPPWPPGTTIGGGDADSYGHPLTRGGALGPDGRMSCELTLPQARTFVTAITIGTADAAVGQTVEVTRQAPVRGLSCRRFGDQVRLTWIWPDEAAVAYVAWQPSAGGEDQPGSSAGRQQFRCSRRAYEAEGGFSASMGHVAQRVEVWAVIAAEGDEHFTDPAEIEVPALGTPVRYDFRPVPGLLNGFLGLVGRRRQRELRLSADVPCVVPDLIVVESRQQVMPLTSHGHRIVLRIPGRPIDPGTPYRELITLDGDGPSWIVCFPDPARPPTARTQVTLFPPPVGRQRW